ncbi:UDP-glycoslytransferase 3 [Artemisia annua]|uniref:UDP-glycoslytransferase 3 n=1 Tax=Artemisia annua TaxID=35608 RepID=A0A2U1KLU0_ARTAN|nr:UDP-glycoslytransferase 3 [Artemisia annua]
MENQKLELFCMLTPLMGHAGQPVELARLLVNRFHHLTITVLVMKLPSDVIGNSYTNTLSSSTGGDDHDRIKFIHFPQLNPGLFAECPFASFRARAVIELHKPIVRERSDSSSQLCALVVDMFCTSMIGVGKEFGVPTYMFFTLNAAFLGIMFYFQNLHDEHGQEISRLY